MGSSALIVTLSVVAAVSCGRDKPQTDRQAHEIGPTSEHLPQGSTKTAAQKTSVDGNAAPLGKHPLADAGIKRIKKLPKPKVDPLVVEKKLKLRELKTPSGRFRIGTRVKRAQRGKVLGPGTTGHSRFITFSPKQSGTVRGFAELQLKGTDSTYTVIVVRWEKQVWHEWLNPLDKKGRRRGEIPKTSTPWAEQLGEPIELPSITLPALPDELTIVE